MKCKLLCNLIAFTFALNGVLKAEASVEHVHCTQPLDEEYGTKYLKPLILYVHQLQDKLNGSNVDGLVNEIKQLKAELSDVSGKLRDKTELLDSYKYNIEYLRDSNKMLLKTNEKLSDELAKLQAPTAVGGNAKFVDELATATKSLSNELTKLQTQTATEAEKIELLFQKHLNNSEQCELLKKLETCAQANKTNEAQKLQIQFKNDDYTTTTTESTPRPDSCKAFGGNPGVHEIKVPGLQHFEVLCQDDSSAGSGWIVIQQRIDGQENFQRDWVTYRDGFGSFDGDFFLGLRQIHHITHSQRYELYIYVEYFGGLWLGARYDNFRVGNEADQFKLQSLGEYHWTKVNNDKMRYHEHMKFTTYDRDNDLWYENCATDQETGGWWYNKCAYCNLNGKYFPREVQDYHSIWWDGPTALRKVQMLIRPY